MPKSRKTDKTHSVQMEAQRRRERILHMRVNLVMTFQQIADREGVSTAYVSRVLTDELQKLAEQREKYAKTYLDQLMHRSAERYRRLSAMVLDASIAPSTRLNAIQAMLQEDNSLAKRLGLDAPAKTEVTVRQEPLNSDELDRAVRSMSPEDRAAILAGDAAAVSSVLERAGVTLQ